MYIALYLYYKNDKNNLTFFINVRYTHTQQKGGNSYEKSKFWY